MKDAGAVEHIIVAAVLLVGIIFVGRYFRRRQLREN